MAVLEELDIDRPTPEERDSHYKPGSIKRVKLKNFLTYDAVEFTPGPRLNVVVGPNGTGKSTILCAICLGLGGQPPLLGRADDARLFIKHEKDVATIEIELAPHINKSNGAPEATHIIRRVIDRDKGKESGKGAGASTYFINGHKSTLKSVKELVSERYHIHIDNLCTFLPQDKVGNFSGFDAQSLLIETEKSLSGYLFQTHQDLMELEKELQSSGTNVSTLENELNKLVKENERLEREKELMEERQLYLDKIDLLQKKRAWLVFDTKREEAKCAKEKREGLKKLKKEAEKAVRPLQEKHAEVEGECSRIRSRYKSLETKVKKDKKAYEDALTKSDNYRDGIETEANEYQAIDAQHRKNKKEVVKEERRLREIEEEGNDFPPMDEVEQTFKNSQREMREIKSQISSEKASANTALERIDSAMTEKNGAASQLERLKDDKKLRLQTFCRVVPTVGKAYEFIDSNRKMFRKKIWGPVAVEVQPKNQSMAAMLENHVANATWKAFVVECKEDYDLLYREVREKRGIPINIVIVDKLESRPRMYSPERMNVLKNEHGFVGYLDETFTAPPQITQLLVNKHNVDKVLVGGEAVHNSLERKDLLEYLSTREANDRRPGKQASCFFYHYKGTTFKYTSQVSRYTGLIGTTTDEITQAKVLKPGTDPSVKTRLVEKIKRAEALIDELKPTVDASRARVEEMNSRGQGISLAFKEAKRTKQEYTTYKQKLRNQRDKVEEARENAAVDNDKEKDKKIAKIKKLVENSIAMAEQAAEYYNQTVKGSYALTGVKMTEDGLSESLRHLTGQLEEKQAETAELTNQYKAADADYNQKKDILRKLLNEAETIAPKEQWQERLDHDDLPNDLEGVEDALDEAENKVNGITDNPHVMRQYEERKKEIAKLQEQLDDVGGEKEMKKSQLKHKYEKWESQLKNIVGEVSEKFSTYMKEVDCAGEVRLSRGKRSDDNEEGENLVYDFKNWGVEICVKFRDTSSLQVLSAQTHSGGERSVSTIMYLMGLQNLMSSPFRCVDEINQGLDERNERLVFQRIVANSTAPAGSSNNDHCGQYFLITPKLLPNLVGMENENITVLFVFSGAYNFQNCLDWSVDKFIEQKQKKRFLMEEDEGEEEVSIPKKRKSKSR